MAFEPEVNQEIIIDNIAYYFAKHPVAPGMPFGQSGRAATVYKLESESGSEAFKVFFDRYRLPSLVSLTDKLARFSAIPGLSVCQRTVLTPQRHANILRPAPDLIYAVLMPWIEGPTWLQVMQDKQALSSEQSLSMSKELANLLSNMEQQGVAHCDLSNANLLFPMLAENQTGKSQSPVELVDVEQIYAASLDRPIFTPSGSEGYAHKTVKEGIWEEKADRFAGAILLAEILGWADPTIRKAAWGEHFFDEKELQNPSNRYEQLRSSLDRYWGKEPARLLERAWNSILLADCPTLGEWVLALPEQIMISPENEGQPVISGDAGTQIPNPQDGTYSVLLSLAEQLFENKNFAGALETYRHAQQLANSKDEWAQIQTKILQVEQLAHQSDSKIHDNEESREFLEREKQPNNPRRKKIVGAPVYFYGIGGLVIVLLSILLVIFNGQRNSPSPFASFTSTVTPNHTSTLTNTITPTITLTNTPAPTKTHRPTSTPLPTRTKTPEPSPIPQGKILYEENFEKGTIIGWDNRSSTPIKFLEENGNHYIRYVATGFAYPGMWKSDNVRNWKNYAFESRVRLRKDAVLICFRVYGKTGAFYNVMLGGNSVVFADYDPNRKDAEAYQTFGETTFYHNAEWRLVRIEARGEDLSVYIDNRLVTSAKRSSLDYGGIAYYTGENGEFDVDDIRVWSLDN